jgi:putative transposase
MNSTGAWAGLGLADAAYRTFAKAHIDEQQLDQIRQATNGNYALGNERFQADIAAALGRRAQRGKAGRPPKHARDG